MDRVRTNATLFAEHSTRIKRNYAALDTRVVSRFTVTRGTVFSLVFLSLTRLTERIPLFFFSLFSFLRFLLGEIFCLSLRRPVFYDHELPSFVEVL